ncbi:hypothetical protein D9M68_738010 [compost metagenome]
MAAGHEDHLAGLQLGALRHRVFKAGRGQAAVQPLSQQGLLAGVVQAQPGGQGFEAGGADGGSAARWRVVEGQLGRWCVVAEGTHHVQA